MKLFRIFNTFVVSAFAVVAFSSCSGKETDYALDVAENLIWTRPDSSLSVLGSVDTLRLRPESSRARFSLLYAMALDRNCIDTADISVLSPAVRYYDRHGSDTDRMVTYYYLGRLYYNGGDYLSAVKCYMQAKEYSMRSVNLVFRGLISSAISDVYAQNNNFPEKIRYSKEALDCFREAGDSCRAWITTGRLASYYADCKDWDKSDSLYSIFLSSPPHDTVVLAEHLFNIARYSLFRPEPDPRQSVAMFQKAVDEYGGKPSAIDYASFAYALDNIGCHRAADSIFSQLEERVNGSVPLMIWKYRMLKHRGKFHEALNMLEQSVVLQEESLNATLNQSVTQAQSDYFKAKSEMMEKDHDIQILVRWIVVLLSVIGLFVVISAYMHGKRKWTRRMSEMSMINEEVSSRLSKEHDALSDKELALRNLRRKYVSTYKRQYSQLNDLCVEYWETAGSGKEKERIYAKVKRLVSVIDDCNQKQLERMIDENLDGIMGKLRADLPDATDNEFRFIALNILGFDAKTIARVMGYTVQSVYTKRARMRAKISEIVSENKDFYLDFIG